MVAALTGRMPAMFASCVAYVPYTALVLNQAHRVDRIKVRSAFREVKCITGKIIVPDGPKAL
jgi:hypothetical protein